MLASALPLRQNAPSPSDVATDCWAATLHFNTGSQACLRLKSKLIAGVTLPSAQNCGPCIRAVVGNIGSQCLAPWNRRDKIKLLMFHGRTLPGQSERVLSGTFTRSHQ